MTYNEVFKAWELFEKEKFPTKLYANLRSTTVETCMELKLREERYTELGCKGSVAKKGKGLFLV